MNTARRGISVLLLLTGLGLLAWKGDPTALQAAGYLPILLYGTLTGGDYTLAGLLQPIVATSLAVVATAGLACAGAYLVWPSKPLLGGLTKQRVLRVRNLAVAIAMAVPIGYALTRLAWFAGIPLGLSRDFLQQIQPIVANGVVLAAGALVGAVLTFGLTRAWGARFPGWLPGLGERPVPVGLARNSAVAVGFAVVSAGCYFIRSSFVGTISIAPPGAETQTAAWLPEMFWPLWGIALIVAALAYAEVRRRDTVQ